jgi:hypothetical protein
LILDQEFADKFLQAIQSPTQIFFSFLAGLVVLHPRHVGIEVTRCRRSAAGQLDVRLAMLAVTHNISNGESSERLAVDEVLLSLYRPYPENEPSRIFEPRQIRWFLPHKFKWVANAEKHG